MDVGGAVVMVRGARVGAGAGDVRWRGGGGGGCAGLAGVGWGGGGGEAGQACFCARDVTSEADVSAALDVAEGLGPLRVAVNCSGSGNVRAASTSTARTRTT